MTYNVFGGALNLAQSNPLRSVLLTGNLIKMCYFMLNVMFT